MKFYIATGLVNVENQQRLRAKLEAKGHTCTYDWGLHGSVQDTTMTIRDQLPVLQETAVAEMDGVRDADFVVVLLPGGRGTHTELGAAIALGKPIFVHLPTGEEIFQADGLTCVFYHHPVVSLSLATSFGTLIDDIEQSMDVDNLVPAVDWGTFVQQMNSVSHYINDWAVGKGFWDDGADRNDGEMIALMHSELSECLEYMRDGNPDSTKIPAFTGVEEEMADLIIRILDMARVRGWAIGSAIEAKMAYNEKRPHKHGRNF